MNIKAREKYVVLTKFSTGEKVALRIIIIDNYSFVIFIFACTLKNEKWGKKEEKKTLGTGET